MLSGKGFEIIIASPPDYENLVAEIYYDGKFVVMVTHENAVDQFDFETPSSNLKEEEIIRKVSLDGLKNALDLACRKLKGEIP